MASKAKQTVPADVPSVAQREADKRNEAARKRIEDAVTSASDAPQAGSNFAGSIEEAFDELEVLGVKDGVGSASLLDSGIVLARHAKALRGKDDKEFQANCMAARLRYVKGFNSVATVKNPRAVIETVGEKAEKANKKQANKLGVFIKAGCMFPTPDSAEAYIERTIDAIGKTDYGAKRESTFELLARVLRKADATSKDETDAALLEKVKPAAPTAKPAEEEKPTETVKVATPAEAALILAATVSQFGALYADRLNDGTKRIVEAFAAEMQSLGKMLHAADAAEAASAAKSEPEQAKAA